MACLVQGEVLWEAWDNYQKQTYRNRCYICTDRGRLMLNIPIRHVGGRHGRQRFREVLIDNTYPWQRQHWRSLETAYRSAPFFEFYETEVRPLYETPFDSLMAWDLATIQLLCRLLDIPYPEAQTESYKEEVTPRVDARGLIHAKTGLDGPQPPYHQVFEDRHGFLPAMSTLDLLFNEGPQAREYLRTLTLPAHG